MKTDTLSYKYRYAVTTEQLFIALMDEQLKYFKHTDPTINRLEKGTEIDARLTPKMQKQQITNRMVVGEIIKNKKFQLITEQLAGKITQTFELVKDRNGSNVIVYSEENQFDNARNQTNFMLVGLLYKFFFNRGMHKKMAQLESLAQQVSV